MNDSEELVRFTATTTTVTTATTTTADCVKERIQCCFAIVPYVSYSCLMLDAFARAR